MRTVLSWGMRLAQMWELRGSCHWASPASAPSWELAFSPHIPAAGAGLWLRKEPTNRGSVNTPRPDQSLSTAGVFQSKLATS